MRFVTRQPTEAGFILPSTLMVVAILMVLILTVVAVSQLEVKSAGYFRNVTQAKLAALSGVKLAETQIMTLKGNYFDYSQIITGTPTSDTGDDSSANASETDSGGVILPTDGLDLGDTQVQLKIYDESSFCDINYADRDELAAIPGMSLELVDTLLDWRDADDEVREFGAESDWYSQLNPGYPAKNEPFDTVDELCLVKGFSKTMLTGTGGNPGLRDYLTVWAQSPNLTPDNQPKLNLKTATAAAIQTRVGTKVSSSEVQAVVNFGRTPGFQNLGQLLTIPGVSRAGVAALIDQVTLNPAATVPGLVNVNTAGVDVLSALPGSTPEIANAIIQARQTQGAFHGLADFINLDAIPTSALAQMIDRVTVGTRRFRIVADVSSGKAKLRLMAVVDWNGTQPQIIYTTYWTTDTVTGGN